MSDWERVAASQCGLIARAQLRDAHGRLLVLEVDGAFHLDVLQWEGDVAREQALSATGRLIVHRTTRELRDEPESVAVDLRRLGWCAA